MNLGTQEKPRVTFISGHLRPEEFARILEVLKKYEGLICMVLYRTTRPQQKIGRAWIANQDRVRTIPASTKKDGTKHHLEGQRRN